MHRSKTGTDGRAWRWAVAAAAVAAIVVPQRGALTATASTLPPAVQDMQTLEHVVAPERTLVQEVRQTLQSHTVFAAVEAAAIEAQQAAELQGVLAPAPSPTTLAQAIDSIDSAVNQAAAIVRSSPAWTLTRQLGLGAVLREITHGSSAQQVVSNLQALGISAGPALRAAGIVARAVDNATPALEAAAASTPPDAAATSPCDILDRSPDLCVSGTGNSTFTKNEDIVIDLGGDDTFENNAGAASPALNIPVALLVDVSGTTTYAAPASEISSQGAGVAGVGMLVQLSGTGSFSAVNKGDFSFHENVPGVAVTGIGSGEAEGEGFLGGAGFLVTSGSGSTYSISSTATGAESGAVGQGDGVFGGVGALVDFGRDNRYSLSSTSYPKQTQLTNPSTGKFQPVTEYGSAATGGQGSGVFAGAGLLFDEGGAESFTQNALLDPAPANAPPDALNPATSTATLETQAFGQGLGSFAAHGMLVTGTGAKTYSLTATMLPSPDALSGVITAVIGQGLGSLGDGELSDLGGGNHLSLTAKGASSVSLTAVDGCTTTTCPPTVTSTAGTVQVAGQGYGSLGTGVLDIRGGNNRLSATGTSAASLNVIDQRTTTERTPIQGFATGDLDTVNAQGIGGLGAGALLIGKGHNTLSVNAASNDTAKASASLAANKPSVAAENAGVTENGQGTGDFGFSGQPDGGGLMAVLNGGGDTFTASGKASATTNGVSAPASVALYVQGAANPTGGLGVAVDLVSPTASNNVWTQSPTYPACSGTRGSGAWEDCNRVGVGYDGP